jgi:hypothetical protein
MLVTHFFVIRYAQHVLLGNVSCKSCIILKRFIQKMFGCPLLATARFRSRAPLSGTACHPTLPHLLALTFSVPA